MVDVKLNYELGDFLFKPKPIKVVISGRGAGKSLGVGDICTIKMHSEKCDIYCLREFQENTSDSVHRVFKGSIEERLKLSGWLIQENRVVSPHGNVTRYVGAARNPDSIKSAEDYKYSWFEEAQKASQKSIDLLLPTILRRPGTECFFSANPDSSEDPFSKRFIMPHEDELRSTGRYEDDLHLILFTSWRSNPWWDETQEKLRQWDYANLSRSKYDWIWEGAFNDSVKDSLILPEWFDACVNAHVKLGFEPLGARMSAHDPSDEGEDSKGYAFRHGSVVLDVQEMTTGNVNAGGDWATNLAIFNQSDTFSWDCDGMGVALARQVSQAFEGKPTTIEMFKGSESPDNPKAILDPALAAIVGQQKTNKEALRNKRAQYYYELRKRIYLTYQAVVHGKYCDPNDLISFSSTIKAISKLRAELCRMPIKPTSNGMFELFTKQEMKSKFKFSSPNLADSVMILMRKPYITTMVPVMPKPIKPIGRR